MANWTHNDYKIVHHFFERNACISIFVASYMHNLHHFMHSYDDGWNHFVVFVAIKLKSESMLSIFTHLILHMLQPF